MRLRHLLVLAGLCLSATSTAALADRAGKLLFVVGDVQIEGKGSRYTAFSGSPIEVGNTVHTGYDGRTQIMMADGALVFLRPGSSFLIEAMSLPAAARNLPAAAPVRTQARSTGGGKVVMSLLRGGLRTISGFIGKSRDDEYQLKTPVATIGIRGTDYTAVYCSASCAGASDGLHLSVAQGQIAISNNGGQIDLYNNQYAYVGSENEAPQRTTEPSPALKSSLPAGDEPVEDPDEGPADPPAQDLGGSPDSVPPSTQEELIPFDPRKRSYASAVSDPPQSTVGRDSISTLTIDGQGALTRFRGSFNPGSGTPSVVEYAIGSASNINLGYDPVTGIGWGRWQGGVATAGGQAINLGQQSLHWIYGPESEVSPALPITGSAHYSLIGNTDPTDNLGHTGVLGSASLSADFTNQTVSNSLALSINNQVWSASGSVPIVPNTPVFGGVYSSVNAGGTSNGASGQFTGFFAPHESGAIPSGAGLSYNLSNGSGSHVSGSAAFGNPVSGQAGLDN